VDNELPSYRWSWLVLLVFFFVAVLAAMWAFTAAAKAKLSHQHKSAPTTAVISTNKN
jgi:hypothetical protein